MRLALSFLALLTSFVAAVSAHDRRDAVTDSLRAGLSALSRPALSDPRTTLNAVIEQYIGILPPATLTAVQQAVSPVLLKLPLRDTLFVEAINNALLSVTASASGNTVTALEQLQECLRRAASMPAENVVCYTAPGGPLSTIQTALDGTIEQSAGYLPPNVVLSLMNNVGYSLSQSGTTAGFYEHISKVINSIVASVSGNTVTALLQVQQCFNDIVQLGDALPSSYQCLVGGPLSSLQAILNGITQQAFGYLPPNLVVDLQAVPLPAELHQTSVYKTALQKAFDASAAGPRFVDCFQALEACLITAVRTRQAEQCSKLQTACPARV